MDITTTASDFTITFQRDSHATGMVHVVRRNGEYMGFGGTRAGAEEMVDMLMVFGHCDTREPRVREAMRVRDARLRDARAQWVADMRR